MSVKVCVCVCVRVCNVYVLYVCLCRVDLRVCVLWVLCGSVNVVCESVYMVCRYSLVSVCGVSAR
jgi:hypothetical protein